MRRIMIRLVQALVSLTVGLAILASLAVWRLSQGPISLNFLNPVLERTFAVNETPFAMRVEDTVMVWGGWRSIIDLRAHNIRLFGQNGKLLALVPEASMGLSIPALAHFELAISRLDVLGLVVSIERAADGRFTYEIPVGAPAGADKAARVGEGTLDALVKPIRDGDGAFRYLRRFSLLNGRFRLIDRQQDYVFDMPRADIVAAFRRDGVETKISLNLNDGGRRTSLDSRIVFDRESGRLSGRLEFKKLSPTLIGRAVSDLRRFSDIAVPVSGDVAFEIGRQWRLHNLHLDLRSRIGAAALTLTYPPAGDGAAVHAVFRNLRIASLAEAAPQFAEYAGLELPVSGRNAGTLSADSRFELSEVDVTAGAGKLDFPGILPQAVSVRKVALRATFTDHLSSARIQNAVIDFGGPVLSATGAYQLAGGSYRVRTDAVATKVPMANLANYWPESLGISARKWVTANIVKGQVTEAKATLALQIPAKDPAAARLDSLTGTLQYQGLDVNYWAPLPHFSGVGGTGSFDKGRLRLALTSGRLRDVALEQSVIDISGLEGADQRIAIDLVLRGGMQTVLQVLNHKPLALVSDLGFPPEVVSGDAVIRTNLRFPLVKDLSTDRIRVDASATMRNVALSPGPYGIDVSHGDLNMRLNDSGLTVGGVARLAALPVTLDWRENFKADAPFRRRVLVSGRVPELNRPGFGLPRIPVAAGPADVSVSLTRSAASETEATAEIELSDVRISMPEIGWQKASGVPGTAILSVAVDASDNISVKQFEIAAPAVTFSGSAHRQGVKKEGWRVKIDRFRNGRSELTGKVDITPDGRVLAAVSGKRFDLEPVLKNGWKSPSSKPRQRQTGHRIRLDAQFDEVVWGDRKQLRDASIMAVHDGRWMRGLVIDGTVGKQGQLEVKYLPASDGQILKITADDFGQLAKSVSSRSEVSGGTLVINGRRRTPDAPLKGEFIANRFKIAEAPMLARVLQVASLSGIVEALSRKGLNFDSFEGAYTYRDARLTLAKAHAHGASVGITVNGVVDFSEDQARLGGTVVPGHTINRVLGTVPVLGPLVTGGENDGVFAANYRVVGPLDDPKVTVNALSALAPGLLRKLFDLGGGAADEQIRVKSNERVPGTE